MFSKSLIDSVKFRLVKIMDIILTCNYMFIGGILISILIDYIIPSLTNIELKQKSAVILYVEIFLHIGILVTFVYFLRNIIEKIPSPFDGVHGLDHSRLKELSGCIILSFSILLFQPDLKRRLFELLSRLPLPKTLDLLKDA